jgi:hypothetical protein
MDQQCKFIFDNSVDFRTSYYDAFGAYVGDDEYIADATSFGDPTGGAFNYTQFISPTSFNRASFQ